MDAIFIFLIVFALMAVILFVIIRKIKRKKSGVIPRNINEPPEQIIPFLDDLS